MTPHENVVRRLAGEWLAKAENDHRAAATLLANTDSLREIIAFHCQQAVEKYLKALLVVCKFNSRELTTSERYWT